MVPRITAAGRRKMLIAARAAYARRPMALLAAAMKISKKKLDGRLRYRLNQSGVKVSAASLGELVAALTDDERHAHRAQIRKLLHTQGSEPMPQANPRVGVEVLSPDGPPGHAKANVTMALAALQRVVRAFGPVALDEYDEIASGVADAIHHLGGTRRRRRQR